MVAQGDEQKQPPGLLRADHGLSPEDIRGIEELAAACTSVDGGRLKLELRTLEARPSGVVNDFLWVGPDSLIGFLGVYGYRPDQVELLGMVHPSWRRLGVFSRLYEAAIAEVARRGVPEALLVVDRLYEAGASFARSRGATIEHSEHRMVLRNEPAHVTADPLVTVRPATRADVPFLIACLAEAFDYPTGLLEAEEVDDLARRFPGTLVIERAAERVGTVRVAREQGAAGIYGFAVLPAHQGRGIGRQVLSGVARELVAEGVAEVGLEVSCTNDSALHLYLSCGFEVTGTEDYYSVTVVPRPKP